MAHSNSKVGVAPGTTTFVIDPVSMILRQNQQMRKDQGLGVVIPYPNSPFPYEAAADMFVRGPYHGSYDKQFHTRGEPGFYYDSPLGGIPTPFQLSRTTAYQNVPTNAPIVPFRQNDGKTLYWTGAWVPPNGYVTTPWASTPSVLGEGEAKAEAEPTGREVVQIITEVLKEHQQRMFYVTAITATATILANLFSISKTIRDLRRDKKASIVNMPRIQEDSDVFIPTSL